MNSDALQKNTRSESIALKSLLYAVQYYSALLSLQEHTAYSAVTFTITKKTAKTITCHFPGRCFECWAERSENFWSGRWRGPIRIFLDRADQWEERRLTFNEQSLNISPRQNKFIVSHLKTGDHSIISNWNMGKLIFTDHSDDIDWKNFLVNVYLILNK